MKNYVIEDESGITLVALILTIIVTIILAAVTIVNLTKFELIDTAINSTMEYIESQSYEVQKLRNDLMSMSTEISENAREANAWRTNE